MWRTERKINDEKIEHSLMNVCFWVSEGEEKQKKEKQGGSGKNIRKKIAENGPNL